MHRRELRFIWMKILRIWLHFMANSDRVLDFLWKLIGILCESKFCITYYVHPTALASNLRGENLFPLGGISLCLNEFLSLFFHLSLCLLLGLFFLSTIWYWCIFHSWVKNVLLLQPAVIWNRQPFLCPYLTWK